MPKTLADEIDAGKDKKAPKLHLCIEIDEAEVLETALQCYQRLLEAGGKRCPVILDEVTGISALLECLSPFIDEAWGLDGWANDEHDRRLS